MLTDTQLKNLTPREKAYKFADRDGLYVAVSPTGGKSFRYDYRVNGRRETLTLGRYDERLPMKGSRPIEELDYGISLSLSEARALLALARRSVERGESPSRAKGEKRSQLAQTLTFGGWAERYFLFKADPNSGAERLADSTLALRQSVYKRILAEPFGRLTLQEVSADKLRGLCKTVKERRGPAPAVQAREIVLLVFRHAAANGYKGRNPAEEVPPKSIASFAARDRALTPAEIRRFLVALDTTPTMPTLRLALRFVLLTLVRKGEFIGATWREIDFENEAWTIPRDRMKADRPHVVYLSDQALDILTTFKACYTASNYLHPGRYDSDVPISDATLNRVIDATVTRINQNLEDGEEEFQSLSVHDLRRTGSTLLHEAGFSKDWIEKALAHEENSVRAVYNKAQYVEQRRIMLQAWADMIDTWVKGESARTIIQKARVEAAAASSDFLVAREL
jgi:integrase